MRFDAVVIGGGLAGHAAAISLSEAGKSCVLISAGQSAMHFSSGSMDFLHTLPDGSPVLFPEKSLDALTAAAPAHPYSVAGKERTLAMALRAEKAFARWGLRTEGSLAAGNHLRLSPMGKFIPTWLSFEDSVTVPVKDGKAVFPWKKVAILSVRDFLDFSPEIAASGPRALGAETVIVFFTLPALETLRANPSEFRSINIARILDKPEHKPRLAEAVREAAKGVDAVFMPAVLCLNRENLLDELKTRARKPVKLISTMTPSLLGARLARKLSRIFLKNGGVLMPKDEVLGFEARETADGVEIANVRTRNHGDIAISGKDYVLATGSFFGRGLVSDRNGAREAVFDLDLAEPPGPRENWSSPDFFAPQPSSTFGVRVDASFGTYMKGKPVKNLKAAGLVIGGFDPVREGCGAGVSLVSALAAADAIAKGE
ncbi:MAG: glycerol-3-phosphate dehydrogenase subunit GlpB [Deltaproteobacteria bacterium]|jgi:glycerol-3-phosphate dehydrogenase subunit B|nr:glycerol-3-phosphate dehydrogenase subunit GlpB [Deltaproteobacteria bacterium]